MIRRIFAALFFGFVLTGLTVPVVADPCGMVPPIYPAGQPTPIARVGLQQTYVFYKDGVETFVIRPGFSGKVDEFGMLIPFPTPPAIRKVPDHLWPKAAELGVLGAGYAYALWLLANITYKSIRK